MNAVQADRATAEALREKIRSVCNFNGVLQFSSDPGLENEMNIRNIVKMVGLASALSTAPLASAGSQLDASEPRSFVSIKAVVLSGQGSGSELTFKNGVPQMIPGATYPLAITLEDGREHAVQMTLYHVAEDGSMKQVMRSFAGFNSKQTIVTYGVSIRLGTVQWASIE
jgi:hypothetical protein